MSKDNGGPAFARPFSKNGEYSDSQQNRSQEGMSLRDYFAAKIIQGIYANPFYDDYDVDDAAELAYMQADTMLAASAK